MTHSPFHVVEDFLSPLQCEEIVRKLALRQPDIAENGQPLKYERLVPVEVAGSVLSEASVLEPLLAQRYFSEVQGDPHLLFQQYWENQKAPAELHGAEGWKFIRKKWSKVKDCDLVGILWLKDYHDSVPLDPRHEVYGGKLEFPAYNFSLTPVRGTLVVFPATPHFVTAMSHVLLGSLEQLKLTWKLEKDWTYEAAKYPGSYVDWFLGNP